MFGFSCFRCTRIFQWPVRPDDDRMPSHLDMLIGLPCTGSGEPVVFYV